MWCSVFVLFVLLYYYYYTYLILYSSLLLIYSLFQIFLSSSIPSRYSLPSFSSSFSPSFLLPFFSSSVLLPLLILLSYNPSPHPPSPLPIFQDILTPHVLSEGNVEWCSFNVCGLCFVMSVGWCLCFERVGY